MHDSRHSLPFQPRSLLIMKTANKAHSEDAPIAILFHIVHHWRRATDAQR